jgi:lipid-binding SYLF domain-containing protein
MSKRHLTKIFLYLFVPLFVVATYAWANDDTKVQDRVQDSGTVMKEILNMPDGIPHHLIDKAACVIVFPSVRKAAFGIGASYGRGVMTCRRDNFKGSWGAPAMMALEGASFGFQIGAQATDFVLLVMNDHGANSILTDKVKLGADASIAAGPKGRDAAAATDVTAGAEILSYSRSRGVFAGVSLAGSTVRPDNDADKDLYGKNISAKEIVLHNAEHVPPAAQQLVATLDHATGEHAGTHYGGQ